MTYFEPTIVRYVIATPKAVPTINIKSNAIALSSYGHRQRR